MNRRDFLRTSAAAAPAAAFLGSRTWADLAPNAKSSGVAVELADPKSFTLVVLPDTQYYSEKWHDHFHNQTKWIADNAEQLNIKYVLHEGDVVNNNGPEQWKVARSAMQRLDGVVPYAIVLGNHDYGAGGSSKDRSTHFNDFFHVAEQKKQPTFGGVMDEGRLENSYHVFEAGGHPYLVLALEWGPRDETVEWADSVAQKHPDHRIVLLTHAYMYFDDTRYDWAKLGDKQTWNPHSYANGKGNASNDGQQLWDKLVKKHPGFLLTLNGHVCDDGVARLTSRGDKGNAVHQLLANYQMNHEGGDGFLRILEFLPDDKTISVRSFSPSLAAYKTDDAQQFALSIETA